MKKKSVLNKTVVFNVEGSTKAKFDVEEITEADFETAISATGFGKFNFLLLILSIPCGWASMMDTTSMSYVIPAAHCDLDLSLQQKGVLNAITYVGMISSALLWGFLADALGRKKILVVGYFLDAIFVIIAGMAQSYEMLLIAKLFTGLIMNGPFAAFTTVISEFHCAKYRTRLLMGLGVMYGFGQLVIPALAWLIIPKNMDVDLLGGNFKLHSWNFFILACSIPSVVAFIGHCFLPESPKFLMTAGKNDEALMVFRKVYGVNTGLHPDTFRIKTLLDETKLNTTEKCATTNNANKTKIEALKEGWKQTVLMFFPPYLWKILLASMVQCGFMLGTNTLRLWLPQIFTAMSDYQTLHPEESASLCTMLSIITPSSNVTVEECVVNDPSDSIYINTMIVSAASIGGYTLISSVINKFGKKQVMIILSVASAIASICLYLAQNSATVVALSTINVTLLGICLSIEIAIVVDMFPTTLRAIAVSITLMIGRSGAMIGNVVYPHLLVWGCLPPFLLPGCVVLCCSILALLLPKTDLKALE